MQFTYKAMDRKGNVIEGSIEASTVENATNAIRKIGYRPLLVKKQTAKGLAKLSFGKGSPKKDELVIFTRQLSAMISAGVPLLRSLNSLSARGETHLEKSVQEVVQSVEGGANFADALAEHKDIFDNIYVNMIRAGEAAGILDDILKRLAVQQEKSSTIRKKVKSATAYPKVLLSITVLAFFGLMIFVIPKIGEITSNMTDGEAGLPKITEIMLAISAFIINWWFIIIPGIVGIVLGIRFYIKTDKGRRAYDRLVLKIPGIKEIMKKIVVSRFTRTFSALMGAGVSVTNALEVTAQALGNSVYEDSLRRGIEEVKGGKQLSDIISAEPELWPDIVGQMLAVGEETGSTETVLTKVADFYDEEVDLAIDKISSIIEPVMILIMGSMVGLIAASVMSPIAGLSQNIK